MIAEQTRLISPLAPVFTSMLLIFTIDLPNSTSNLKPSKPLMGPEKSWTAVLVDASVHNLWSDSSSPLPSLFWWSMKHQTYSHFHCQVPLCCSHLHRLGTELGAVGGRWHQCLDPHHHRLWSCAVCIWRTGMQKSQKCVPVHMKIKH